MRRYLVSFNDDYLLVYYVVTKWSTWQWEEKQDKASSIPPRGQRWIRIRRPCLGSRAGCSTLRRSTAWNKSQSWVILGRLRCYWCWNCWITASHDKWLLSFQNMRQLISVCMLICSHGSYCYFYFYTCITFLVNSIQKCCLFHSKKRALTDPGGWIGRLPCDQDRCVGEAEDQVEERRKPSSFFLAHAPPSELKSLILHDHYFRKKTLEVGLTPPSCIFAFPLPSPSDTPSIGLRES